MQEEPQVYKSERKPFVLLIGATGYVGGRLLPRLLAEGYRVRCACRRPEHFSRIDPAGFEVLKADLLDCLSLELALKGVDVAFYLAHSLGSAVDFEQKERACAENFAKAAKTAGVKRIIYLGGLGSGSDLSPHLRTRQEVGRILRDSGIQTIEFRASIIIGSGSLSFEMVRALVQRLPVMITPRWLKAKAQPIAIEDVLAYLTAAVRIEMEGSQIVEIGGPDIVSYMDIIRIYSKRRGVCRFMIPVPVLTPYLSSLWLGLVTPLYARVGRKLIDSIRHDTLVENQEAAKCFSVTPRGLKEAIDRALENEDEEFARTKWSDAVSAAGEIPVWGGVKFGTRLVDSRSVTVHCSTAKAFAPIRTIGGENGWYYANWAWSLRGFLDLLLGGVGIRRGRRNSETVAVGDAVDFWRVEAVEADKLLRMRAEMKLPGRAWLQFEVEGGEGFSTITQTAIFDPLGVLGQVYWYALFPMHQLIFRGMLRGIAQRAV